MSPPCRQRPSLPLVALLLVAACSGRQKVEDALPAAARPVHAQLPGDAALLLRLSVDGVRDLQTFVRSLGADPAKSLVQLAEARPETHGGALVRTGPVLLAGLTQLLDAEAAGAGLDPARPVFAALWSIDADRLVQAASLGLPPEPADRPRGVATTLLFPVTNAQAWSEHLRRWWSAKPMSSATEARITADGEWVRMVVFAQWPKVEPEAQGTIAEAFAAFSSRPAPAPLRLTPALASFLAEPADLALHQPLERAREFTVAQLILEGDERAAPMREPLSRRLRAAAEAARSYQALEPSFAEVEDWTFRFDAQGADGFAVEGLSTLTAEGQRYAKLRGTPPSLPKLRDAGTLAELTVASAGSFVAGESKRIPGLMKPAREGDVDEDFRMPNPELPAVALLTVFSRSPMAAMGTLLADRKEAKDASGLLALQVRAYPPLGGDGESGAIPRVVALLSFADEASADRVAERIRGLLKDGGAASMVRVERPATEKGQSPLVAVGLLAVPSELMVEPGVRAPLPEGSTLTVGGGVLDVIGAQRLERLATLSRLLRAGAFEMRATPEDTVSRFSLRIGAAPALAGAPTLRFEAISHAPPAEGECAVVIGSSGLELLGRAMQLGPHAQVGSRDIDAMYGEVDRFQAQCAMHASTAPRAAEARARLGRLRETFARAQVPPPEPTPQPLPKPSPRPEEPRMRVLFPDDAPTKGAPEAKVTVVLFSDFECPFCARVEGTLKEVEKRYGSDVRFVFLNQPLAFHPNALPAARAALAAHAQGKFWEYKDLLFSDIRNLKDEALIERAQKLGLDLRRFNRDRASDEIEAKVKRDMALAQKFGATGTPTFFINGKKFTGAQPLERFVEVIDAELARADAMLAEGAPRSQLYERLVAEGLEAVKPPPAPSGALGTPVEAAPKYRHVPLPETATPVHGSPQALVTVVEFVSYQCPFCARAEPTMRAMGKKYGKDLRRVIVHNPLPFHQHSAAASKLVLLAAQRKKGPQMHALLLENNRALDRESLVKHAAKLGIDEKSLDAALESEALQTAIDEHMALARKVGANGTPTFFINGRELVGARGEHEFDEAISEELERARAALKRGVPRGKLYETLSAGP